MSQPSSHLSSALKKSSFLSPSLAPARVSQLTPTCPASRVSFLKDSLRTALNISYCNMSFNAPLTAKPMDEVNKILQQFIATINEIDETAFIAQCNQTFSQEDRSYSFTPKLLIPSEYSLSKFSSKLSQFFPQCKLRNNKTYSKVQFIHSYSLDDIVSNIKDELSNHNFSILKKLSNNGTSLLLDGLCDLTQEATLTTS